MAYLGDVGDRIPGLDLRAVRAARAFHQEIQDAVTGNQQLDEYH